MKLIFSFAADKNFVLPLVVSLTSLARNCHSPIKVVVFTTDIPNTIRQKILKVFRLKAPHGSSLDWFDLNVCLINHFPLGLKHLSVLAYARIFIPKLIGWDEGELIYLDCDTIITGNILDWIGAEPIKNFPVAAVRDCITPNWDLPCGLRYLAGKVENISAYPIFNSGVMRINIHSWLYDRVEEKCLTFIEEHGENVKSDQDALNYVFRDRWLPLHPKWNIQTIFQGSQELNSDFLKEINQVSLVHSALIHFSIADKPWNSGLRNNRRINLWIEALYKSGWFNPVTFQIWRGHRFVGLSWKFLWRHIARA